MTDSGKMILDIAHLIDRKYVERYQNKFTSTAAMMKECHLQLSGPWPPYHFVHRLTRGVHAPAHTPSHAPAVATSAIQPVSPQLEPALAAV
jgi:hypothetical protein